MTETSTTTVAATTTISEHGQHALTALRFHLWGYDYVVWPSELIGLAMIVFIGWAFWHAHNAPAKKNPINLGEMFVWPGTNHTSLAMVLAFIGGMIACWVVIDQELKGKLTEGIYVSFLGIIVLGKASTEAINAWRNKPAAPPATPPTQANVVVQQNPPAPPAS